MPLLSFTRAGLTALALGSGLTATAAPLPDMPETLIEKSRLLRDSRDRVWDPASGRLGDLRQVRIVADGCTVRVVSGPDNRLIGPRDKVEVGEDRYNPGDKAVPRDVVLRVRGGAQQPRGTPCLTLQVATADDLILSGDHASYLFDRVEQPAMRIYVNPSSQLRVWFEDVKMGLLSLKSNAWALAGGTGQVQWLQLTSTQSSTAMLFHELNARHIGVSSLTKTHTGNVETFKSGDFGFLGEVWDDKVVFSRTPLRRQHIDIGTAEMPRVEILAMFGGADGGLMRYAVDQGAKGIVVQAVGMGNMNVSMFEAVKYALSKGVPVVISTRVHNGRTYPLYGFPGGGKTTFEAGAVMAGDLNPQKARLLLMLMLHQGKSSKAELQAAFDR